MLFDWDLISGPASCSDQMINCFTDEMIVEGVDYRSYVDYMSTCLSVWEEKKVDLWAGELRRMLFDWDLIWGQASYSDQMIVEESRWWSTVSLIRWLWREGGQIMINSLSLVTGKGALHCHLVLEQGWEVHSFRVASYPLMAQGRLIKWLHLIKQLQTNINRTSNVRMFGPPVYYLSQEKESVLHCHLLFEQGWHRTRFWLKGVWSSDFIWSNIWWQNELDI